MSLDVYLTTKTPVARRGSGIFVRENGRTVEISSEEWNARNPGHTPVVVQQSDETCEAYSANITHNLNEMAEAAGIYKHLWRPEEIGITHAAQLIAPLKAGIARMKESPEQMKAHNPENGWGSYQDFLPWLEDYLAACEAHPEAEVSVSR